MKNLRLLSFALLFWILVISWCENTNNQENLSCEGEDTCPIESNVESPSIEIEESPMVIVDVNDEWVLDWNWEWFRDSELNDEEQAGVEVVDEPMMRILIDENTDIDEIEITPEQTCGALGWTWNEWDCTLQDGSKVYF